VTRSASARSIARAFAVAILSCGVLLLLATSAGADIRYLYDELGRLVRVIREDGEAASYHYDAVGNILRITRASGVAQTTSVTSTSTSILAQGSTVSVTLSGSNLVGATLFTAVAGLTLQDIHTDFDQITLTFVVAPDAQLGATQVDVRGGLGVVPVSFTVVAPPPVITELLPSGGPVGTTVRISGENFDAQAPANNVVQFNGVSATVLLAQSFRIFARVGAGTTSGLVTVTTLSGTATSADPFTVNAAAIVTVAGNGDSAFSGDGGPATAAGLETPWGVAVDAAGNVYATNSGVGGPVPNHRIRKVDGAGFIDTIAGLGEPGFSGDGGPATAARLNYPIGVATDGQGNLYIAERDNHRIRKVDTSGVITTLAGDGTAGFGGDGGSATSAQLNTPVGVVVDGPGNVYITDSNNHRIRRVDTNGVITTVAGDGTAAFGGDGGPATGAQLNVPSGVALDAQGNLYIGDLENQRVRRVDTSGTITTVAGDGTAGFGGDGGPATSAQLHDPAGVAVDSLGTVYIADSDNHRIRKVTSAGTITTAAGNGTAGFTGDGGPPTDASLNYPTGVALAGDGSLYIADRDNNRIRKIGPAGL
jgi:YD repeat-containing protein